MAEIRMEDVIRRPMITEKNTWLMERDQYTFEVLPDANKIQIKEAVEKTFDVRVKAVNTMVYKQRERVRGTRGGRGRIKGHEARWKKAVVTLMPGQRIDIFEQV